MDTHSSFIDRIIHSSFRFKAIVVLCVIIASILGFMAFREMPRNVYPDITIPVFTIVTENEAMAPEEVETIISRPMEAAMNGLPGVRRIRSQTTQGLSSVVVEFDIETDFWRARQFVAERMSQVATQLPAGTEPPTLSSATTRLAEVYELTIEGDIPLLELRELAEWQVRPNLLSVPGVAEVLTMGGYLRQFKIILEPALMRDQGVSVSDVEKAVQEANENSSGGFVSTGPTEYTVRGIGRFESAKDIEDTIITERNGIPLFLSDIAKVEDSTAVRRGVASKNGKEAVVALVIKQPNADTVDVIKGIESSIEDLKSSLPKDVRLVNHYSQADLIDHSLTSVIQAIMIGAVLVIIVLLAFMGNLASTLIVAISLPLSVTIAASVMSYLGVGINTMSLGGLAISVGIMVDASIIMVENIHHRLQRSSLKAGEEANLEKVSHRAATEVGRPIAFATLIILAVFLPLFLMGGIEGLLFRPLALTVAAAMVVALALSLTLTPVLASRLLKPKKGKEEAEDSWIMAWIKRIYAPALDFALKHKVGVVLATLVLLVATVLGVRQVGTDFMPKLDEGAWFVSAVTPADTSLEENSRITGVVEGIFLKNPNVDSVVRRSGRSERAIGCVLPVNTTELLVNLKPRSKRTASADVILAQARREVSKLAGVALAFSQPLQNKIDESMEGTPAPLQVKLFGPDLLVLAEKGALLEGIVRDTKGVVDAKLTQATGIPQLQVVVNRRAAARYGVSPSQVSELVRLAIGGEETTQVWKNQRSYGVVLRFPETMRSNPTEIGNMPVNTSSGATVPLTQVADVRMTLGPNVVWREAMNRRVSVDAGIEGRDLGSVVSDIRSRLKELGLPSDSYVVFGGQYENQKRAMNALALAAIIAISIVFMLLFLALNSASHAGLILATVPSAFIGGVAALLVTGETLNVSSSVGFIALFGIAVQNSLVLLVQTRSFEAEGFSMHDAIRHAGIQRLRPKLMTALCAALGLMPILLTQGVGAEIEKPLAIVMVGGLISSTLFTLLVLPAAFVILEEAKSRWRLKRS
jgi:cobalt-zinc-cadmium resistance protein CzcA